MTLDSAIQEIARLAEEATGVQLDARHRPMIQSRLQRRLTELGLPDLPAYVHYLDAHLAAEKSVLISLLTTHHTYFFREIAHFEYLRDLGLGEVVKAMRAQGRSTLKIWSAACSRGQEAYSLAMWILPWLAKNAPDIKLAIVGSDVDEESVRMATNGVYPKADLDTVPLSLLSTHWARGTGDIAAYVKAKRSLRDCVEFKVENLFELSAPTEKFDFIFCRNVFIYFKPEQIAAIGREMQNRLQPHGTFFVGISESLSGLRLDLDPVAPSAYRLKSAVPKAFVSEPAPVVCLPIRVLCVDDSPTILTLLKKILVPENGFEVVATALNGLEAAARLKERTVDLVTLDIHMPEMDGITYLSRHFSSAHPPVVMLSSVSRENSDLALKALELGAADYIEKPSLSDARERGDEIRFKLKSALASPKPGVTFDRQFERRLALLAPVSSARLVFCSLKDWKRVSEALVQITPGDPGTLIWIEGNESLLESVRGRFSASRALPVLDNAAALAPGRIAILGHRSQWPEVLQALRGKQVSILHYGPLEPQVENLVAALPDAQLLLEDTGHNGQTASAKKRKGAWLLPATSFFYQSHEYFSGVKRAA